MKMGEEDKAVVAALRSHAVHALGIHEVDAEKFLWLAEESLREKLSERWQVCSDDDGNAYYYDEETNGSTWEHPVDARYRHLYYRIKAGKKRTRDTATSTPEQSDAPKRIEASTNTEERVDEALQQKLKAQEEDFKKVRMALEVDLEQVTAFAEEQVRALEEERSQRLVADESVKRLRKMIDEKCDANDILVAEKKQLHKNLDTLVNSVQEASASRDTQAKFIEEERAKVAEYESQHNSMRVTIQALKREIADMREAKLKSEEEIAKLSAEAARAASKSSAQERVEADRRAVYDSQKSLIASLKLQLKEAKESGGDADALAAVREECNAKVKEANAHAGKIIRDALSEKITLQQTVAALRTQLERMKIDQGGPSSSSQSCSA